MKSRKWIDDELDGNLERANRAGIVAAGAEPRAIEARYVHGTRSLKVWLSNGATLQLPVAAITELRGVGRARLLDIEILPGGDALHWAAIDVTISVPGLVASLFGPSTWMSELGRRGGARSTLAKAEAARRNGVRGGRPRANAAGQRES